MNKNEVERRVRTWYSAEIVEGRSAPLSLRAAVDAIPSEVPSARRPSRRRFLLLAAALVTVGMGGALAVGSSLFRTSTVQPKPAPPIVAVVSPSPEVSLEASPVPTSIASPAEPLVAPSSVPGFRTVGDMTAARFQHTATLLDDGRVLIVGGTSVADRSLGTTEFWDPATEQFTSGPQLAVSRFGHTATRLADGRVVVIGGFVNVGRDLLGTRQVELWDPATGTFRAAGRTLVPRSGGLSTVLLADGRVLIIGGADCDVPPVNMEARRACKRDTLKTEIWDPATESSSMTGPLEEEKDWAAATLLDDGRVFVLGYGGLPTIGAEVWDPATGTWSRGGNPADARTGGGTVTRLPDGRVLIVGGQTGTLNGNEPFPPPLRRADLWHPATSSYSQSGSLEVRRERHTATLLPDGRVLIVGGTGARTDDFTDLSIAEAEVRDPYSGKFASAGQAAVARTLHTATLLDDGRVLITGGILRSELADPVTQTDTGSAEIWAP
jgi:hypothetical protein